jgi:hypothetical protein
MNGDPVSLGLHDFPGVTNAVTGDRSGRDGRVSSQEPFNVSGLRAERPMGLGSALPVATLCGHLSRNDRRGIS